MSLNRWAKRRDANEADIVSRLKARGIDVMLSDKVDLIVGYGGQTWLFEIKDPEKCLRADGVTIKAGSITPSQRKLAAFWKGHYKIVTNIRQILIDINYTTKSTSYIEEVSNVKYVSGKTLREEDKTH